MGLTAGAGICQIMPSCHGTLLLMPTVVLRVQEETKQ